MLRASKPLANIWLDRVDGLDARERVKVREDLLALERKITVNPLLLFHPHPAQEEFMAARTRLKAFYGGNRAGKSVAGILDSIVQAVDTDCVPEHLLHLKQYEPPFYCRIVTPDFIATMERVIYMHLRDWLPPEQLVGDSWDAAYNKLKRQLMFKNGSFFEFMSYEQDRDKFGGAARHRVVYDEVPPEDIRTECKMRLRDYDGDELFTMTPFGGWDSWIIAEIDERAQLPNVTLVTSDVDNNPHVSQREKQEYFRGLTKEEIMVRKEGKRADFAGPVFREFDEKTHVIDEYIPEDLLGQDVIVGIDPGIGFTGVCWVAFDGNNVGTVFDSFKVADTTVDLIAMHIRKINEKWQIKRPNYYVIDPSARRRDAVNAESVEGEFARFGIRCVHGQNDVETGIFQLKRRLGTNTIFICRNNTDLLQELARYRIDERSQKFAVIKKHDHILDAWRYVCMSRPRIGPAIRTGQRKNGGRKPVVNGYAREWNPEDDYVSTVGTGGYMT